MFIQTSMSAQALSLENISMNIRSSIQHHLSGKNKHIVQKMYENNYYNVIWVGESNKRKLSQLLKALKDPMFNYKNKAFDQKEIRKYFYKLDNKEINSDEKVAVYSRLDLMLSNSYVRLVRFIVQGDVNWNLVQKKLRYLKESEGINSRWEMSPKAFPSISPLLSSISSGNIYSYLNSLIPMKKRYVKLVSLLHRYKQMNKFPQIPYRNDVYKRGDRNGDIQIIKQRLQISGDLAKSASLSKKFDKNLENAVLLYQKRNLLNITGTVDKTLAYYLNQPLAQKIASIIVNLDKTKLYPRSFESNHIEINIPDFQMRYYSNSIKTAQMDIIVGRIDRPTPLFNSYMRYMVLNPTWTIPDNLIKKDLIHVLKEDPTYMEENNIHAYSGNKEVHMTYDMISSYEDSSRRVPYRFVQLPGDNNALGRVKFIFPNKYSVYLHDTDNRSLFDHRYKIYSSGCVRVAKPFLLTNLLLKYATHSYSQAQLKNIFDSNKSTTIRFDRALPVHMVYFTTYEENGIAYFKHDIYLYDKIIAESSYGYAKPSFSIPEKRMISIKKKENPTLSN